MTALTVVARAAGHSSGAINDNAHDTLDAAALDQGGSDLSSVRLQASMSDDDRELSLVASIAHSEQVTAQNIIQNIGGGDTDNQGHGDTAPHESDFAAAVSSHDTAMHWLHS